ncbi:hypothetical protein DRQ50_10685, partial [bacterium]
MDTNAIDTVFDQPPDPADQTKLEERLRMLVEARDRTLVDRVSPGDLIGPYRLVAKAGEGPLGEVWLAWHQQPAGHHVALKILRSEPDTEAVLDRFHASRSARSKLDHPAMVQVRDVEETSRGRTCLATEFIKGPTITAYCSAQLPTAEQRLELFLQLCDVVQYIHDRGHAHGNLKPGNVLVVTPSDGPPQVRVLDLGLALDVSCDDGETLPPASAYMSPEQVSGEVAVGGMSGDVFALGVLLHQVLTGVVPGDETDSQALMDDGLE